MNFNDALFALSDGNPGAINVMLDNLKQGDEIDPQNGLGAWGFLLNLDNFGIYGSRIWRLYKNLCDERLPIAVAMVRSVQMGIISKEDLDAAIDGKKNLNPDEVAERLKRELTEFKTSLPGIFDQERV